MPDPNEKMVVDTKTDGATQPGEKQVTGAVMQPVPVTIIGTMKDVVPASGTVAATPKDTQPNLVVKVITPIMAVTVRFVNTFLTVMLGLITGSLATNVIPAHDFFDLLWKCAGLSVAGAGIGLIKDLVTIFGRLEGKYPLLTGSV